MFRMKLGRNNNKWPHRPLVITF